MLAPPLGLCLLGHAAVGVHLGVDLVGELGVVGERGLDEVAGKPEDLDRPADPFRGGNVAAADAFDDLPHLSSEDAFATRWRSQPVADSALSVLQVDVGGRNGTYRFSGHSTFRGQPVSVYTITRPTATFKGMTIVNPRVVVFVSSDGRIVRYSITQSELGKAMHFRSKRATSWTVFYDFGANVSISRPAT